MKQTFNEKLNIPNWISLDEVCKILSLKEKTVKNKCRNAELTYKVVRNGKQLEYYISSTSIPENLLNLYFTETRTKSDAYSDVPEWAKAQADKYLTIITACSGLRGQQLKDYINTWNNVNPDFPEENISVYVAPGGSGVGVSAAIDKTADFGMVARAMKDSEVEALGADYSEYIVARDALTVSVNAENPYIRDLSGGAYEVFQTAVMGDSEVAASATQSASMTELATNIANDPWGIGYAGFGAYNAANADGQVLYAFKVDGVEATEENILSGEYTIQRPVMFVTGDPVSESEQAFIDYVFSETGYEVVEANGYIPAFTI